MTPEPSLRTFTSPRPSPVQSAAHEDENPKDVIGREKVPLHLIPPAAQIEEAIVLAHGAGKYGPYNWREKRICQTVYIAATLRHLMQHLDGEDIDPESGRPHIAHARATLGILIDATTLGRVIDDRPSAGVAGKLIRSALPVDSSVDSSLTNGKAGAS
jgi:hypothetical protein